MRKASAVVAALSLSAVALTGCTAAPSFEGAVCDRAAATSGVDDLVTVSGEFGAKPTVSMYSPLHVSQTSFTDLTVGEGTPLTTGDQVTVLDLVLYSGTTGEQVIATEFNGDLARLSNIDTWAQQIPGVATVLECATEGTRLLAAITPEDFGQAGLQGFGFAPNDTVIAVIDVVKNYLPRAEGSLQFNAGAGLPTVVRAPDGRPGIIVPDTPAPTQLVTQVLIKGDGEPVKADQRLRVHSTGVVWDTREVFASSWDGNPPQLDLSSEIPGLTEALEGQTVGSQVMIVVPPELGYGDQPQGNIPADSTLVFVIDILGLDPAA